MNRASRETSTAVGSRGPYWPTAADGTEWQYIGRRRDLCLLPYTQYTVCVTCDAVCRCRVACVPYRYDRPSVRPSAVADSTPATADDCHNSTAVITSSAADNTAVRCRRPDYICAPTAHYTPVHTVFHTHVLCTKERRSTSRYSVDGMAKKVPEERETRVLLLYTRS